MYSENKFIKHKEIWESVQAIINTECKELNTLDQPLWHKGWNAVIHSFPFRFFFKYIYNDHCFWNSPFSEVYLKDHSMENKYCPAKTIRNMLEKQV